MGDFMYYLNIFFICSFFGFIMETSLKYLFFSSMNNGILFGPWVPVYGFGALIVVLLTDFIFGKMKIKRIAKIIITVLLAIFVLTILEFCAGNLIEIIFGKIFWDYSDLKFSYGHYIALEISLVWGVFTLIFMYLIRPFLDKFVKKIPNWVSILVLVFFIIDCVVTCFLI